MPRIFVFGFLFICIDSLLCLEITHLYEKWIQLNVTGEQSNLRLNELSGNLTNLERKINLTGFQNHFILIGLF